jgi:hypothetical protein
MYMLSSWKRDRLWISIYLEKSGFYDEVKKARQFIKDDYEKNKNVVFVPTIKTDLFAYTLATQRPKAKGLGWIENIWFILIRPITLILIGLFFINLHLFALFLCRMWAVVYFKWTRRFLFRTTVRRLRRYGNRFLPKIFSDVAILCYYYLRNDYVYLFDNYLNLYEFIERRVTLFFFYIKGDLATYVFDFILMTKRQFTLWILFIWFCVFCGIYLVY